MNSPQQTKPFYVVGSQQLQNALLTEFLVKEEVATKSIPSVETISVETLREFDQNLFLVDYHSVDVNEVIAHLLEADQEVDNDVLIALFNVDSDDSLSRLAGLPMVNGGFQHDCPQALLSKGIKAIFDGHGPKPTAKRSHAVCLVCGVKVSPFLNHSHAMSTFP